MWRIKVEVGLKGMNGLYVLNNIQARVYTDRELYRRMDEEQFVQITLSALI